MCLPSGQRRRVPWPLHPSRPLRSNPSSQKSASASLTDHISRKTFFWASCLCNPSILAHGVILRVPGRVTSASSVSFNPNQDEAINHDMRRYEVYFLFCCPVYDNMRDVLFTKMLISFGWMFKKNLSCAAGREPLLYFLCQFWERRQSYF